MPRRDLTLTLHPQPSGTAGTAVKARRGAVPAARRDAPTSTRSARQARSMMHAFMAEPGVEGEDDEA